MRQKQEAMEFAGRIEAMKVSAAPAVQKEWEARTKGMAEEIRRAARIFIERTRGSVR